MSGFELLSKSTLEFHARGAEERKRNHFPVIVNEIPPCTGPYFGDRECRGGAAVDKACGLS